MQHDFPQHGRHGSRRSSANCILHVGEIFLEHTPVIIRHFRDVSRSDAHSVIWKDAKGGGLFNWRDFDRAQCYRQIGGNAGGDSEPMGVVNDGFDTHTVREFQRRDIT